MHVFVTGASGWVGSAVLPELLSHGHTVLALARSDSAAQKLEEQGVEVQPGSLDDLDSIKAGAAKADGVIHLAFKHDFENYIANGKLDEQVVTAIGDTLRGTNKPFVLASGTALYAFDPSRPAGKPLDEDEPVPPHMHQQPRIASQLLAMKYASEGVRTSIVRLPPSVHGKGDSGFVAAAIGMARKNGFAAYIASNTPTFWCGVNVRDAAVVFRLALEKAPAGSAFHAVGNDDGLSFKEMATIIGDKLDVPVKGVTQEEAGEALGFLAKFATLNSVAKTEKTKATLGWQPKETTLQEELRAEGSSYF
ncbi:hypothetical protein JCM6882_008103 [Rhodosporidiobolus microsporus]